MGEPGGAGFVTGCHVAPGRQGAAKADPQVERYPALVGMDWAREEDQNGFVATWQLAHENDGGRQEMHHG